MGVYITVGQSIVSNSGEYYKILEFIGNGANAYAYRCLCTSGANKGIEFVLKLQYNLSTPARYRRFLKEAAFLQTTNHPAILRQYDRGLFVNQYPFIITDYMPCSLKDKMEKEQISFLQKVKYSCQLLSAICFLQSKNIIHRDIKPNNIFISGDDAILGDFGLIKDLSSSDTGETITDDINLVKSTVMHGVIGYIAMAKYYRTPELVNYANHTDKLHIESDVFQLGLVLTELFTNTNPLVEVSDILEPVTLNSVGYIDHEIHGKNIHNTLCGMLNLDYHCRLSADLALDRFTGILQSLVV